MKATHLLAVGLAALAAGLGATATATAEQPFERCPADFDAWASVPGPVACEAGWTVDRFMPAGTRCSFDVAIHFDATARIYHYDNPPRTDAHLVEIGTATNLANGKTLTRTARYTEIASGPIVFTDHGVTRYSLPDGGTVTVRAGFTQDSEVPPLPEVFHGNPFDDADVAAFCAALS
jgi:hypothetical protein